MGNAQSTEDRKQPSREHSLQSRTQRKEVKREEKREARELAEASAKLARAFGHSSLAEAYIGEAATLLMALFARFRGPPHLRA